MQHVEVGTDPPQQRETSHHTFSAPQEPFWLRIPQLHTSRKKSEFVACTYQAHRVQKKKLMLCALWNVACTYQAHSVEKNSCCVHFSSEFNSEGAAVPHLSCEEGVLLILCFGLPPGPLQAHQPLLEGVQLPVV